MKKVVFVSLLMVAGLVRAVSFDEARSVFNNSYTNPPPGILSGGGYLFHVFDSYPGLDEGETIMKDQMRSLKGYVGRPKEIVSPFDRSLAEKLTPMLEFRIPECAAFTIERKYHDSYVRVVTAFEAAPIDRARELANAERAAKRTLTDWETSLRSLYLAGEEDDRFKLLGELGATRRVLASLNGIKKLFGTTDYLALENVLAHWDVKNATVEDCTRMLELFPLHHQALRKLSDARSREGDFFSALDLELTACAVSLDTYRIRKTIENLEHSYDATKWKSLADLYEKAQAEDLTFGGKALFWRAVRGSMGKVSFVARKTKASDGGAFEKAKALFRPYKGKNVKHDLEIATALLVKSIECDPSDGEKWRYYASALRADNKQIEAVIAYWEALTLNPGDDVAATDLLLLYDKIGYKQLAEGDAWWMLIAGADKESVKKAREFIKGKYSDKFADE